MALALLTDSFHISLTAYCFAFAASECWFGPAVSVIQKTLPAHLRGTGVAVFMILTNFSGSFAVFIMGLSNDKFDEVRYEVLVATTLTYTLSALGFGATARQFMKAACRAEEQKPIRDSTSSCSCSCWDWFQLRQPALLETSKLVQPSGDL